MFTLIYIFIKINFFQWVGSIDINANDEADDNVLVKLGQSWKEQVINILQIANFYIFKINRLYFHQLL